jgi:polyribonucleotide nucleotidyltransferase
LRPSVASRRGISPKIVSFEIPVDKIGDVIGPKGKVINSIQSETGAEISVDDDGVIGTVSISATEKSVVDEAERQIRLILDPPTADVGETYAGRVVNITKFGAFVNILPGRDGLLHISKIGGNRRIDKVEDVLELGQEVDVEVEDIDPNGKISLRIVGEGSSGGGSGSDGAAGGRNGGGGTATAVATRTETESDAIEMPFEDEFGSTELEDFGELGPEGAPLVAEDDRGGRSSRGRSGRGGGRGGGGRGGGGGGGRGRGRGRNRD